MKKAIFLFVFLVFFAESIAKTTVYFKELEIINEDTKKIIEVENLTETVNGFSDLIKAELSNSFTVEKDNRDKAKYAITAILQNTVGGDRLDVVFEARDGKNAVIASKQISFDVTKRKEARDKIREGADDFRNKIKDHESRNDNNLRAFVPGWMQFRKGYPVLGTAIIATFGGALLGGGGYAYKASSNNDEAAASRKKAALATNVDDFNRHNSEAEAYDSDFKTERGIAIGMFGTALAVYIVNIVTAKVLPYDTKSNTTLMPMISPKGEAMAGLYLTTSF